MKRHPLRSALLLLAVVLAAAGCGKSPASSIVPNLRPTVDLSFAPVSNDSVTYSVRINWFGSDGDGQVVGFQYTVDPPASPVPGNDTVWVNTTSSELALFFPSTQPRRPLAPPGTIVPSSDYHTFVIRAIDNEGARSAPVSRSFTSFTIAPETVILIPSPTSQLAVSTTPSLTISWAGRDFDGTQRPVKYKFKLAPASDISPNNPENIPAGRIQEYFEADAFNFFASWDSVSGDTTSKFYEGLTTQARYYFAVIAIDEAGAYEPRFSLNTNVLQFRPTLDKLGPKIRVFNEFFSRLQSGSGVSTSESRIVNLEFPADAELVFNWQATPPAGALITGYRWAVDLADITDETQREDDADTDHWSTWSLNETSALVGPFSASVETSSTHKFFVQARDNLGFVTMFTIRLIIVKPSFEKQVLVVDDMYGRPTQGLGGGTINLAGAYPLEAEQDTFYYARGGVPDSLYIRGGFPGTISQRGVFADYAPDTLDYWFYPIDGMDLLTLSKYRLVCWYVDKASSARNGAKFGSQTPATAIRTINSVSRLNTLAVYLRQGGNAWIFGDGTTTAIANGYWSRFGIVPSIPYNTGEEPTEVLFPGNFLYDFCHLRSQLNLAGTSTFLATQLQACIPYLPEFIGPASDGNRLLDPRINLTSAQRMAIRWAGLPRLTLASYRTANANPALRSIADSWVITLPLQITNGSPNFTPDVDTLYLCQARQYDPNRIYGEDSSDGFPNAIHYHGLQNGPSTPFSPKPSQLVWMGFPLHYFERSQVRIVVDKVMENFGIDKAPPSLRGAHPVSTGGLRIVSNGETVDDRAAETRRGTR
jgi:hypothetical protein